MLISLFFDNMQYLKTCIFICYAAAPVWYCGSRGWTSIQSPWPWNL